MITALSVLGCIFGYALIGVVLGRIIYNLAITREFERRRKSRPYETTEYSYKQVKAYSMVSFWATAVGVMWPVGFMAIPVMWAVTKTGKLFPDNAVEKLIKAEKQNEKEIEALENLVIDARMAGLDVKGLQKIIEAKKAKN